MEYCAYSEHSTTSSFLEVSWCYSVVLPSIIVIAIVAAPSIHCSHSFDSAGLLFALPFLFETYQINSHTISIPPEFVVGAAVPAFPCGD